MNEYFLYIKFKSSKGNFNFQGKFQKLFYSISDECVEILCQIGSKENESSRLREFDEIQKIKGVGTFLDILALSTEILTSCDYEGRVYRIDDETKQEFYSNSTDFRKLISKRLVCLNNFSCDSNFSVIKEGRNCNYSIEAMKLFQYLLEGFEKCEIKNSNMVSVLNYWRKGLTLDLEHLGFGEESYLNFYKIIEYFFEINSFSSSVKIPFIKLSLYIKKEKIGDKKINNTLINKFNIKNNKALTEMIMDFIEIRNNWDVAHQKTKKSKHVEDRDYWFNITLHEDIWNYNDYIKEISRFIILRYLGFDNLQLVSNGGLYELSLIKNRP